MTSPTVETTPRSRWRSRPFVIGGALIAIVVIVGIILLVSGGSSSTSTASATTHTALVTRQNLDERETVDGTLGYANPITLTAEGGASSTSSASTSSASSGRGGGASTSTASTSTTSTITSIASEGSVVTMGHPLFAINNDPTILLYGSTPMYRELNQSAAAGPDILQLEYDLKLLGFDPGTVDGEYTSATAAAVESWEESLGRATPDGVVSLGEVVFEPGPVRVGTHDVEVGETVASGGTVMDITGTNHVVTVDLDATDENLAKPGDSALVTFPDGSSLSGLIYIVGKVATSTSSSTGTASASATIPVTIVFPTNDAKVPDLDQAPVTVGITSEARQNVLAVPVTALLALAECGYGLEVVQPSGGTKILAVQVGVYANNFVEVSGNGISEGTRVVTG